jgi:hypothetical protein
MDEFGDLDKEIAKLREDLSKGEDQWTRQFHFPSNGDYWKRRLEEEKTLWDRKMASKQDETSKLQSQIASQQSMLDKYNKAIEELERKMESDSSRWDERLKTKEAELVFEKNRILWEEKVKESEAKNHVLIEKVSDLNEKIGDLKDEQLKDRDRLNSEFGVEKKAYDETVSSYTFQIEVLKKRTDELENSIKFKCEEFDKLSRQYDELKASQDAITSKLQSEKAELTRENENIRKNSELSAKKSEEEMISQKQHHDEIVRDLIDSVYSKLGPLIGLTKMIVEKKVTAKAWNPVRVYLQNIENDIETFAKSSQLTVAGKIKYSICAAAINDDKVFFDKLRENDVFNIKFVDFRDMQSELVSNKPNIAAFSARYYKTAFMVKKKWPFLPVVVFGDVKKRLQKKSESLGIARFSQPYIMDSVISSMNQCALNSAVWPEGWREIRAESKLITKLILSLGIVLMLACAAFYVSHKKGGADTVIPYTLPYPQPTNIAISNGKLWACDWLGQSVYVHNIKENMKIEKIYYYPGRHFSAITWAGGYLWSCDPMERKIYKHEDNENLSVVETFPAPGAAPSGICYDGEYLYTCDSSEGMIYRHRMDRNLSVETAVKSPGLSPAGLYYDGKNVWSLDSSTNKIYCHNMDNNLTVEKVYVAAGYDQKGYNLSGIAMGKDRFYICSEKLGKLIAYPKSALNQVQ